MPLKTYLNWNNDFIIPIQVLSVRMAIKVISMRYPYFLI